MEGRTGQQPGFCEGASYRIIYIAVATSLHDSFESGEPVLDNQTVMGQLRIIQLTVKCGIHMRLKVA